MDKNLALETLKSFIENTDNVIAKDAILALHPELAESENERIRKRLIDCLKVSLKGAEEQDAAGCSRQKDIEAYKWGIAYLEKQKEQRQVVEALVKAGLKPYRDGNQWCVLVGDSSQEGVCGFGDTIDDALYDFLVTVLNMQKEQEHSLNFDVVSSWLREHASKYVNREFNEFHKCIEYDGTIDIETLIADLKFAVGYTADAPLGQDNNLNLIYPEDLQKSKEWGKEDEMRINEVIETLNIVQENRERTVRTHYSKTAIDKDIDWLHHKFKSLRPQQHWKPSEEQMGALFAASERNDKLGAILLSLYNDLKKL